MQRLFYLILTATVAVFVLTGCGSSKTTPEPKYVITNFRDQKPVDKPSEKKDSGKERQSGGDLQALSKKLGMTVTSSDNYNLYKEVAAWLGTPYKYGAMSKSGVDCSGFVYSVYQAVYRRTLQRSSASMLTDNCVRINKNQLKEGDLVFFRTDGKRTTTPNHVGIYLKNNKFAHSSTSKGVVVSDLTSDYYARTLISGGRVK